MPPGAGDITVRIIYFNFQELSKDSPASRQLAIWRAVVVPGILLLEYFTLIFNSKDSPGAYENHPGNKAIRRALAMILLISARDIPVRTSYYYTQNINVILDWIFHTLEIAVPA